MPRTVFLAEDDIDDQDFLRDAFNQLNPNIHLISFSTGVKFMQGLAKTTDENLPQLIVLDYNIPELNGAEILEELNKDERYANIPKVVWSTSDSQLYRQTSLSSGAKAYLVKPPNITGITSVARQMLGFCNPAS